MKKNIALLFSFLLFLSCSKSDDTKTEDIITNELPKISVSQPIISQGNLKFIGTIISVGSGYNRRGFCWGQNINPTLNNSSYIEEFTDTVGEFFLNESYGSSNFLTNTNYYIRAFASANNGEIVYSDNLTITTPPKMIVNESLTRNIYTTSATLNSFIAVNYIESVTPDEKGFCYKTSSGVTIANGLKKSILTYDYSNVNLELTDLLVNTTYYVKAFVREGSTYYYSNEFTFKTSGAIGLSGGYVFFNKGEFTDGWQYLEAAPSNLIYNGSNKIQWGCVGFKVNQTVGTMGAGPANTARIVSQCASINCAARQCDNYTINGLSDWFLPSDEELMAFYKSSINVYNIATNPWNDNSDKYFWSSTESGNATEARILDAYSGYLWQYDKNYGLVRVRPFRRY